MQCIAEWAPATWTSTTTIANHIKVTDLIHELCLGGEQTDDRLSNGFKLLSIGTALADQEKEALHQCQEELLGTPKNPVGLSDEELENHSADNELTLYFRVDDGEVERQAPLGSRVVFLFGVEVRLQSLHHCAHLWQITDDSWSDRETHIPMLKQTFLNARFYSLSER